MKNIQGTQTEKNLLTAFAGESQARNRYEFFASKAKKEGFVHISRIFEETAIQEKAHASTFYKLMQGGDVEITSSFHAGGNASTEDNLRIAAGGENHEHTEMYPDFAKTARNEGFENIASVFEAVANAEKQHEKRFQELADNIANNRVFKRKQKTSWRCLNCGYHHEGDEAPDKCPACNHSKAYFEMLGENW
jgi:rubrerythrin